MAKVTRAGAEEVSNICAKGIRELESLQSISLAKGSRRMIHPFVTAAGR